MVWKLVSEFGSDAIETEPARLRQKSRDFYWYSPVLKRQLATVQGDGLATPRTEADVIALAGACYRHDTPLTVRGGGSGNYGQCMPLKGGLVLDMTQMCEVMWVKPGAARLQAGANMLAADRLFAETGQALRLYPSTRAISTMAGFIAGGSGGIGSINWGFLRHAGNILGARLITCEASPRILELRGEDIAKFNHSYGVTGILTEIEMPLAPLQTWIDAVAAFDDFAAAMRCGQVLAEEPGILKNECAVMAAPITAHYLRPISGDIAETDHTLLAMIGAQSIEAFAGLIARHGGRVLAQKRTEDVLAANDVPIYELTWNHTTLWALKRDPSLTYLQTGLPAGAVVETALKLHTHFGDEVMMHVEFTRNGPTMSAAALQIVRFTTEERLFEIMAFQEAMGCRQFNPHVYTIEDGGMKQVNATQLAFKRETDPKGLLNPGKMRAWDDPTLAAAPAGA